MELTTLDAFLRTVRYGVVSRLASDDITRISGNDGVLVRVDDGMTRQSFAMAIIRLLNRMHCDPILSLLAITRFAEVDQNAMGVE